MVTRVRERVQDIGKLSLSCQIAHRTGKCRYSCTFFASLGFGGVSGVVGMCFHWQRCIVAEMSIGMGVVSRGGRGPS